MGCVDRDIKANSVFHKGKDFYTGFNGYAEIVRIKKWTGLAMYILLYIHIVMYPPASVI